MGTRTLAPALARSASAGVNVDKIEFLLMKQKRTPGRNLRQDWAGALRDQREQYTSLELQRKALDWRGDCGTRHQVDEPIS